MKRSISQILLAEDLNEHYINFVQAINALSNTIDVMRVENGYDLLSLLETNIKPDIIFLDIDMPYKGGIQILEEIQGKINMQKTPVVILSASSIDITLKLAYQLGALLFVRKYKRVADLKKVLSQVFESEYFLAGKQPPFEDFVID